MDHANARARAGQAVGEVAGPVRAAIVDDDHLVLPQARDGGENVLDGTLEVGDLVVRGDEDGDADVHFSQSPAGRDPGLPSARRSTARRRS